MDPLSLTASVIAVATLATQTCKAFSKLRGLHAAVPGRLHALNNEVADIELVLRQVAVVARERKSLPSTENQQQDLEHLLLQANTRLSELKAIVNRLCDSCANGKAGVIFRGYRWQREHERLQSLQNSIHSVKSNLNVFLGTSQTRDMVRVRLGIEQISAIAAQSSSKQTEFKQELLQHSELYHRVDQRVGRIMELLEDQSNRLHEGHSTQIGPSYRVPPRRRRRLPAATADGKTSGGHQLEGVGLKVLKYANSCHSSCPCSCHDHRRSGSPAFFDRVLGQLFVGYAGLPYFSPKCSHDRCLKGQAPYVSLEYWFPLGFFWSQIVSVHAAFSQSFGPQFQLKTLRRVPDTAPCVNFALEGNIDGLKELFVRGLASPQDISNIRGYSLLRWALYGKQYETCRFLFYAGADPDYKPISRQDDNPKNKASDFLLQGALSTEAAEFLSCLTSSSDFVEEQNFTPLHRIVLGLSLLDLEKEIQNDPDNVDLADGLGRTALMWASARGDQRAVTILLSYRADPNLLDSQNSGPVMYAAAQNHAACVRLLLEAGADPDPQLKGLQMQRGSPLNCAARIASDPLVLKTLLDFGADVESCGAEGRTSLLHAARSDNIDFAILLLDYGANINATTSTGQTALTTTITHNSHNVLRLLLDRWQEFSSCPRLKGPHLLQVTATYADLETIRILACVDHFAISYDRTYTHGDFESRLRQRPFVDAGLADGFAELLSVIDSCPTAQEAKETLLETGLLLRDANQDQDSDEERFEDAKELLEPAV